jgi:hypothetical protein
VACADDLNAVVETAETNNCLASTGTMQIVLPTSRLRSSPARRRLPRRRQLKPAETVKNLGTVTAAASTTRYYLSLTTSPGWHRSRDAVRTRHFRRTKLERQCDL